MKRYMYQELLLWKNKKNRKPLLLEGARQVGKTYLLKEFGDKEYKDCAYFNFEKTPELDSLFKSSIDSITIIESLELFIGRKIDSKSTLIFFDEIQASPRAVTSLKYFCEETPEYHVVSAGSLLGVSVSRISSFPVGKVNFMMLYPLSFFEYLDAIGENLLIKLIEEKMDYIQIQEIIHEKLIRYYKMYLFLGGMPEVVQSYINNNNIIDVRNIQNEILNAYKRDFSKYTSSTEAIRISEIWRSIPIQLAKENKKFKYSAVIKGGRASKFESAIEWLRKAGLIYIVDNLKTPKLPLSGYVDKKKFKLYLLDSGLLGAMLKIHSNLIVNDNKLFSEYNGAFIENYVASELTKTGYEDLFYWTSNFEAEVDFIIFNNENEIIPIEVKSGLSRRKKSLNVYIEKYKPNMSIRLSPRNFTRDGELANIPLYAIPFLNWKNKLENFENRQE